MTSYRVPVHPTNWWQVLVVIPWKLALTSFVPGAIAMAMWRTYFDPHWSTMWHLSNGNAVQNVAMFFAMLLFSWALPDAAVWAAMGGVGSQEDLNRLSKIYRYLFRQWRHYWGRDIPSTRYYLLQR